MSSHPTACTGTIRPESPRAAEWRQVFGSETVPLESPVPHVGSVPGLGSTVLYKLDLSAIDAAQRRRLVALGCVDGGDGPDGCADPGGRRHHRANSGHPAADWRTSMSMQPTTELPYALRRGPLPNGDQQITRIPRWRPGLWVKLAHNAPEGLAGKVLRVKSLTCAITEPDQARALWRVHFENGRSVAWYLVERQATEEEVRAVRQRQL